MSLPSSDQPMAPRALVLLVATPIFLAISNQTMISVALPAIGADLGALTRLPWLVVGYMLALTVSGPLYGVFGDSHGLSRMLMTAIGVYVAGTLVCAFAPTLEVLATGRLVQGLGGGGLMSMSQALIGQFVSSRERGRAQGQVATIAIVALTLGPGIGGLLVDALGWRSLFLATLPLAFLALAVLRFRRLPDVVSSTRRGFDMASFLWLNLFVLSWTLGLDFLRTPDHGVLTAFAALFGAVSLVALVRRQRTSANPLFPPSLFAIVAVRRANVMIACHGAALVSLMTILPLFQTILRGEPIVEVAFTILALTVAFGVGGILTGYLVTMTGHLALFPMLSLPVAGAGIAFLGFFGDDLSRPWMIAIYFAIGFTIGPVMGVANIMVQHVVPDALRGRASGTVTFFRSIGGVFGTALVSLVLFGLAPLPNGSAADLGAIAAGATAMHDEWRTAFQWAFLTVAAFTVGGWSMALTTPARRVD